MNFKTLMDPNADFRLAARDRIAERQATNLERAAEQQDKRAARMSGKMLRGNRRAAKAASRASALHQQANR